MNEILSKKQHGFRSGRSCLTQMLSHFDDILLGFTNGFDTDSIYLDYAKAFDKVDHKLLLMKLQKYGFSSQLISWIRSFLTERKQCVVLDGHRSVLASIISGVPQGTVLGPSFSFYSSTIFKAASNILMLAFLLITPVSLSKLIV